LLLFDDTQEDLERNGWRVFIDKFEGLKLVVTQQFALTFDGCRAKIRDVQLEVNENFISSATGLPVEGQRWFKNLKVDEVPWPLLFTSRKINNCDKGMLVTSLKSRWHDLLAIIKQFVTCEGRYGLLFLYHLRLLMSFIDIPLNMPHFILRSLYKMAKHFKREKVDSSLFHHCLIKIIVVHQLKLSGDCCNSFLVRNGFASPKIGQVDKTVVTETLVGPVITPPTIFPSVEPSTYPNATQQNTLPDSCPKDSGNPVKRSAKKKGKRNSDINCKGKKATCWVSRCALNKPKENTDQKPILLSEDFDSEIKQFLTEEYPYSHRLCSVKPYDYVTNLPPCLRYDPNFLGIKLDKGTASQLRSSSPVITRPDQP
jgi:hypothetical protein